MENNIGQVEGGNVSDLGEYYYELTAFTDRIKAGEKINKAELKEGFETLDYLLSIIYNK